MPTGKNRTAESIVLENFALWCKAEGRPAVISKESYQRFGDFLHQRYTKAVTNQKLRHLYRAGICSENLDTRDYFFENFRDLRKVSTIVTERWWPALARVLVPGLKISERNRVVRELDNFFRWQQRTAGFAPETRVRLLFLTEGISDRTKYQRLSRLCTGLDAISPGDPDLRYLRELQHTLCGRVWTRVSKPSSGARRVPEIENLLTARIHQEDGRPLAKSTIESYRRTLMLHMDLMKEVGRGLEFDRNALDVFADHLWTKVAIEDYACPAIPEMQAEKAKDPEWCDLTAWSMCERLAPFVSNATLRAEWNSFIRFLKRRANERGQPKRKERALSKRPIDLEFLYGRAHELCNMADAEVNVQRRWGLYIVIGVLGILLFYPLRRSDLLRLRIGYELKFHRGRWLLAPEFAQKTGTSVSSLVMSDEAAFLIEFSLLKGAPRAHLVEIYESSKGRPMFASPRRLGAYEEGAFSTLFFRWIGHRPHIVRSIWCDNLIEFGADRNTIRAMLQHTSLISQKDYEILAGKVRLTKALSALRKLANAAMTCRVTVGPAKSGSKV